MPDAQVDELLPRADVIVGQTQLSARRLSQARRLRAVLNVEGNFLPNVDYDECFARGIEVLSIGPVFGQAVAELSLGMALALARDLVRADQEMRVGHEHLYDFGTNHRSFLLSRKTVGLVGCGSLGRALLPLLRPFNTRVLVYDPWLEATEIEKLGATKSELVELFSASRVVFLLAVPTTENAEMIDRSCFETMEPGSVVVLTSRAAIVNWPDLLDAASSGRIRAGIDVFPVEPVPVDEAARNTPNTLLSPHRGGNVPEVWPTVGEMVAHDLEALFEGSPDRLLQAADPATVALLRARPIG